MAGARLATTGVVGDLHMVYQWTGATYPLVHAALGASDMVRVELHADVVATDSRDQAESVVDALDQARAVVEAVERLDQDGRLLPCSQVGDLAYVLDREAQLISLGLPGLLLADERVEPATSETRSELESDRRVVPKFGRAFKISEHTTVPVSEIAPVEVQ